MAENEDAMSSDEGSEKQYGVILGFWDQEKTPALIEDLEHSVNLIELKCKKLLEQLIYFKKYLEELDNPHSNKFFLTLKGKHSKNGKKQMLSESNPDITFRKCQIQCQEVEEKFKQNFQQELMTINKQLSYACEKIGLKETGFLFPTDEYIKNLNSATANDACGSWFDLREDFIKMNSVKLSPKSEPTTPDLNVEFSKITLNELGLYQKLSKLKFSKGRELVRGVKKEKKVSGLLGRRVNLKFRLRKGLQKGVRKNSLLEKGVLKNKATSNKKAMLEKKVKPGIPRSLLVKPRSTLKSPEAPAVSKNMLNNRKETLSSAFPDAFVKNCLPKTFGKVEDASDLSSFARRVIPFTPCSSTSKSFNIGMNIQQFLSKTKYYKPNSAGARGIREEPTKVDTCPWNHQVEEKEKVWIAKTSDRKCRSRFTRCSPDSFLEYHKSTTRRFTNGEKSFIKSESKRAYAVGSKIMVSDCETTDYFQMREKGSFYPNDSGDELCHERSSKLSTEWTKVYVAFLHLYRKYGELKKQMENVDILSSEAELESLGNEVDNAINKYKDFLKFYSKFLHLRYRLKFLKTTCEANTLTPATSFPCDPHRRRTGSRTTYSIAMKEALRHVQTLHNQIRLEIWSIVEMLQVMSAGLTQLPHRTRPDDPNVLNCWEKPSPLIKELERTVNFAERKCGDLMQQLSFYKEYYEKWAHSDRVSHPSHKKKVKKCCRQALDYESSSENELEKVNQYLYKKIKNKITEMNNEITQANRKLARKIENPPPKHNQTSTSSPREKTPPPPVDNKTCKSEPSVTLSKKQGPPSSDTAKAVTQKQSSKSVPSRSKTPKKRESGPLKRRYSSLQRYKLRSKSLPQGVRRKFGFGGFFEVVEPVINNEENITSCSRSKTSLKSRKSDGKSKSAEKNNFYYKYRGMGARSTRSLHSRCSKSKSDVRPISRGAGNYVSRSSIKSEITTNSQRAQQKQQLTPQKLADGSEYKAIVSSDPSIEVPESCSKTAFALQNLSHFIAKPKILAPFLRHPIPFIPVSSTSKTFNLGLNVQQVLSLIKHKRHSVSLEAIVRNGVQAAQALVEKPEPTLNTLFFSQTTTSHSHVASRVCPAREGSDVSFSILTDSTHCHSKCTILNQIQTSRSKTSEDKKVEVEKVPERPEDVWVVEQPDAGSTKIRTKCTCFPSKQCVDYHKVLRQYTGWKLPGVKAESYMSDSHSSYGPVFTVNKSKMYAVPTGEGVEFGFRGADKKIELTKVHNDLTNLHRKYSSLQEQISQNNADDYETNAELEAMESELAVREVEFKDILNFYNQLMELKEKLKSLRLRSTRSQASCDRPKRDPLRPTPSMALTKVLRKIQGLQDKIKLIDAP